MSAMTPLHPTAVCAVTSPLATTPVAACRITQGLVVKVVLVVMAALPANADLVKDVAHVTVVMQAGRLAKEKAS